MENKNTIYKSRVNFISNIVFPSILALVLFIGSLFWIVIPRFETAMMDRKREMINELTNTATSILEKYHKDELSGKLSRDSAQQKAITRIQYLRYGEEKKDYFWISDMEPKMVAHPYRDDLIGDNLENYLDSYGVPMFLEFKRVVEEEGEGYVEYMWQWKDDSTQIVPKLSYVKGFEPWQWIVGTGIYIEDVKKEISELSSTFTNISIVISLIVSIILFWVGKQSFKIEKKKRTAENELNISKEKYRSLVEASTEGLLMIMDNKISFVNPVFSKISGLNENEILNKKVSDIFELPDDILIKMEKNEFNFDQKSFESSIINTKNNEKTDIILKILPINFYGKTSVILSIKDVSTDKMIKEELIFSKDKFKVLMDNLNIGIFRTSLDTKGSLLDSNQTALNAFGIKDHKDLEGKYILDFFVDENDKKSFRSNLLQKGFLKDKKIKLRKVTGEIFVASVSLSVIYDNKQPKFCDGIINPIAEEKLIPGYLEDINIGYNNFINQFYQKAIKLSEEPLVVDHDININSLAEKMNEYSANFALVKTKDDNILGYVTDKIIRERALSQDSLQISKAYEIMTSPIPKIDSDANLLEALHIFDSLNCDLLVFKNSENRYISKNRLFTLQKFAQPVLLNRINNAKNKHEIKSIRDDFIKFLLPIIYNNSNSRIIFKNLSMLSDLIVKKTIENAFNELGQAPCKFAFISMGSEGRAEQSLKTDQDNALIIDDTDENFNFDDVKEYFLKFSEMVCTDLDFIGYNFCKGKVMAMNPKWCQPLSIWKNYFSKWIKNGSAQDLLDISIFFDFRIIYGEESLSTELKNHVYQLSNKNPAYLYQLSLNALKLKPQVGFWGNILLETAGAPPETVNIKKAIMPIISFARIYSLKNNMEVLNTVDRLNKLFDEEVITEETFKNISQAFDYLSVLRLKHQADLISNNVKPDNLINTKLLSEIDKTIIKKILSSINGMLSKLGYDFKGTM